MGNRLGCNTRGQNQHYLKRFDLDVNVNWQKNILGQMKSYDCNDSHDGSQI